MGLVDLVRRQFPNASIYLTHPVPVAREYRASGARLAREGGFQPRHTVEEAFLEITEAVRSGVFRNPKWDGYAAAPMPSSAS
jgi:hypothetical protein